MDALTYRLDQFEGPLDALLALIQKSKYKIEDVPISLLCDQYLELIRQAQEDNMDIAAEFIVMASELMLLKSRLLLPKPDAEAEEATVRFLDVLDKHNQAKAAMPLLARMYAAHEGRLVKDTDEITVDVSYVADQEVSSLCLAIRRIISYNENLANAKRVSFTPMIAKPIVPVEVKIVGILHKVKKQGSATLGELIADSPSLPDTIAIFLGVLELIKTHDIQIVEDPDEAGIIHGENTRFIFHDTGNDKPGGDSDENAKKEADDETFSPVDQITAEVP